MPKLALVGLPLLAVLLFLAFSDSGSERTGLMAAQVGAEAGPIEIPMAGGDGPSLPSRSRVQRNEAAQQSETEEAATLPALGEGRQVRVLDADTGRTVAGAEVFFVPDSKPNPDWIPGRRLEAYRFDDPESGMSGRVKPYLAGEGGSLRIPEGRGVLMARKEKRYGFCEVGPDLNSPLAVYLEADSSLTVRLLHHDGSPAGGIDLVLSQEFDSEPYWHEQIETDAASGEARFAHLGERLRWVREGVYKSAFERSRILIAAVVHTEELVHLPLPLDALPTETVDLILPPLGSLEVHLTGSESGEALPHDIDVDLWRVGIDDGRSIESLVNWHIQVLDFDSEGVARYPHVGLGLDFQVVVDLPGNVGVPDVLVHGPKAPGQTVTVRVPLPPKSYTLRARLYGPDDEPVDSKRVRLQFDSGSGGKARYLSERTDESGNLEFFVSQGSSIVKTPGNVQVRLSVEADGEVWMADAAWWPQPGTETVDWGSLYLSVAPVLFSGVVVNAKGEPAPEVRVQAKSRTLEKGKTKTRTLRGCSTGETDEKGRFEIRGRTDVGEVELRLSNRDLGTTVHHPVRVGSQDLRLVLDSHGSLAGSLLLERPLDNEHFRVRARSQDDDSKSYRASLSQSGTFRWRALAPGTYDVEFHMPVQEEPWHVVEGVEVAGLAENTDERLERIAPPEFHRIVLEFRSSRGYLLEWGEALVVPTGQSEQEPHEFWVEGGYCEVASIWPRVDVEAEFWLHHPVTVAGVSEDRVIEVRSYPRVTLRPQTPLPSELNFELDLEPLGEREYESNEKDLQALGEVAYWLSEPGTWEFGWFARHKDSWRELELPAVQAEVSELAEQEIIFDVDWEALLQAAREVEAREKAEQEAGAKGQ